MVLESEIIKEISPGVFGRHQGSPGWMILRNLNIVVLLVRWRPVELPEGVRREDVGVMPVYEVSPRQLQGKAGHQGRGDVLRYETRRVDTGVEELLGRGG